jgi:hypothetical protein
VPSGQPLFAYMGPDFGAALKPMRSLLGWQQLIGIRGLLAREGAATSPDMGAHFSGKPALRRPFSIKRLAQTF